jgi:hypothetical protein
MPSKRPDAPTEHPDVMLRMGKYNNFVAWLEIMKTDAGALCGLLEDQHPSNLLP